jgi:hypothetical protein
MNRSGKSRKPELGGISGTLEADVPGKHIHIMVDIRCHALIQDTHKLSLQMLLLTRPFAHINPLSYEADVAAVP